VSYGDEGGDVFLGRDFTARRDYSEHTAQQIDKEVAGLLNDLYDKAKGLLEVHRDKLDDIAQALLERETLDRHDLALLMRGETLPALASPLGDGAGPEKSGKPKPERDFPGGKVPDPEPVPS
jgi:cell division protease FtsH